MEMDRASARDSQAAMDATRLHGDRPFSNLHLQKDYLHLYDQQRARMHETNQMFHSRDDHQRQPFSQPTEMCSLKEEPISVGYELGSEMKDGNCVKENSPLFPSTQSSSDHSPQASQSQVKEEPQEQGGEGERHEGNRHLQQTDPSESPINKAGESPDLPTDSARIQANEDQQEAFCNSMEGYKHNESSERISPFDESYQMGEDRMGDGDDTMDSSSGVGDSDMDHLSRLQQAMELSGMMTGKEGDTGDKPQVFQCHLCTYSGTSRYHFNAHLNTHYDHKCAKCEFTAHTEPKLREHMQEEHGLSPDSTEDLEGIRVPRVNAQGKVKTFKCKQCDYIAITKSDFWEHARSHIKSEKLLTCPKCPFVTEYKHHLEYHLRNHFGSKPFKCNKCNYSCVNKSMLNSHMKSHSNIYQYRCSDCTYATKYCHSLKLHLRKYGHNPAMVLNPDGSPNPIPIIDVYGTRRGPKLKKDEKGMPILPPHYQIQAELLKAQMQMTGAIPQPVTSPRPREKTQPPAPVQPPQFPPTSLSGPPHSQFPYPHPNMMETFPNSSPILSRALEKSPEEHPRSQEGREQLRELLLERDRVAHKNPLSPKDIIRCSQCEFVTENRETFAQHMAIHVSSERREDNDEPPHSPMPMETSLSPEHRRIPSPRPLLVPHQPPPLNSDAPLYTPLAAAHLKEYLARAMNPFLYQQMVSGQLHPAFGLQHHLQRFGHPAFPGPPPILPEEDRRQRSPPPMPQPLHQPQLQPQPQSQPQPQPQSQPQPQPQLQPQPQPQPITQAISPTTTDGVLDLSKEQTPLQQLGLVKEQTPPQQVRNTNKEPPPIHQQRESRSSLSPNHSSPQSSSPTRSETSTPPSKNRRKGRAFKLERIALRLSESAEGESSGHDEDVRREDEESQNKSEVSRMPPLMPLVQPDGPQEEWQSAHHCQFCDMAFKDVVMYTMHMGYHGYRNPFTCNMCGHQATDKVAFFLHIARSSHS